MNDRELLELAAKAAGLLNAEYDESQQTVHYERTDRKHFRMTSWNPFTDDGDAFRLSVGLGMERYFGNDEGTPSIYVGVAVAQNRPIRFYSEPVGNDPYAATRRAIVRAAAEIGKMKGGK